MECAQAVREWFRRRAIEEGHGRHRRLLRARHDSILHRNVSQTPLDFVYRLDSALG
jgi:hypothetical protein